MCALTRGANSIFIRENFTRNVRSTVFRNAPAGVIYPGDAGFPSGSSGLAKKWWNFSPRAGVAWDVVTGPDTSFPVGGTFASGLVETIPGVFLGTGPCS